MSDIIDELDRLHAKATPGPWKAIDRFGILGADCSKVRDWEIPNADLIVALVNNWPVISARLREAERKAINLPTDRTKMIERACATSASPRPQCPPNVTIMQGKPPTRDAVFGPGCSPHPLDEVPATADDPAIVQALACYKACHLARLLDEHGNLRKIIGTLPVTADGCIVGYDEFGDPGPVYHPKHGRSNTNGGFTAGTRNDDGGDIVFWLEFSEPSGMFCYELVAECYGTREAAERAAKGGTDGH